MGDSRAMLLRALRAPLRAVRAPVQMQAARAFTTSRPAFGHNLEDHYDLAEYMCKMHSHGAEYVFVGLGCLVVAMTGGPILHSNYYFGGTFLPKDQSSTQLCDDSW